MAKVEKHPTTEELVDIDSKYSSMRWAFILMVKAGIALTFIGAIGMIITSILEKQFPTAGITALVGVVFTTAFGGKSIQSFSENKLESVSTEAPSSTTPTN